MKKKALLIWLVPLLVISLGFFGCQSTTTSTTQVTTSSSSTASPPPTSQPIVLKYGNPLPDFHAHSIADINWMNKIEEETQGKVKFERYFGGTLIGGDEGYTELTQGVADVDWFSRIAKPAGYDIGLFMETAFALVPYDDALPIMSELSAKFPQIRQEYSAIKPMCDFTVLGYYELLTANKAVRKAEDLKGMTVDCPEPYATVLSNMGGSPVSMGPPDWYMALQKSTIDGIVLFTESVNGMKFSEVIKYITMVDYGDGPEINRGMNLNTWNKLPADIQAVFERNIPYLTSQVVEQFQKANSAGLDTARQVGIEFVQLPPDEKAKLDDMIMKVQDERAAKLDAKGLPGTEIMKEVRSLTEKYSK